MGYMKGQLRQVLMACVAVLAVFALFDRWWSIVYVLLPTVPLLASLFAMTWVNGTAYEWWMRFAIPWTAAAMAAITVTPFSGKPFVSTLAAIILSAVTLVVIWNKVLLKYYRIALSESN